MNDAHCVDGRGGSARQKTLIKSWLPQPPNRRPPCCVLPRIRPYGLGALRRSSFDVPRGAMAGRRNENEMMIPTGAKWEKGSPPHSARRALPWMSTRRTDEASKLFVLEPTSHVEADERQVVQEPQEGQIVRREKDSGDAGLRVNLHLAVPASELEDRE